MVYQKGDVVEILNDHEPTIGGKQIHKLLVGSTAVVQGRLRSTLGNSDIYQVYGMNNKHESGVYDYVLESNIKLVKAANETKIGSTNHQYKLGDKVKIMTQGCWDNNGIGTVTHLGSKDCPKLGIQCGEHELQFMSYDLVPYVEPKPNPTDVRPVSIESNSVETNIKVDATLMTESWLLFGNLYFTKPKNGV